VFLRFSYITDSYVAEEGIYIDYVNPVAACEGKSFVAESVSDTFYVIRPDETGNYAYQVSAVDDEGHRSRESNLVFYSVDDLTDDELAPDYRTALRQNYPNPFNPSTKIRFSIGAGDMKSSGKARVVISVYDVQGRKVSALFDRVLPPGEYSTSWSGVDAEGDPLASGIYFVKLVVNGHHFSRKMVLLR
jgi:hypothetical protein